VCEQVKIAWSQIRTVGRMEKIASGSSRSSVPSYDL
jgi:hypothetical protein